MKCACPICGRVVDLRHDRVASHRATRLATSGPRCPGVGEPARAIDARIKLHNELAARRSARP